MESIELGLRIGGLIFLVGAAIIVNTLGVYFFYILWGNRVWEKVHGTNVEYGVALGYAVMVAGLFIALLTVQAWLFGLV